ncbi:hypothetical protein [Roseovarius ramblicola]|uniref:UrcA family protein n=1 Tax=Roseovarius ramblicola TaxID=2022336 RepID=A0ABV5HVZ5_9RHOB
MAKGRVAPALLVLLLGVRVATAAAVECQHELADAARAAERTQEARLAEVVALGGELCLYATGAPSDNAQQEDGPHLSTPCPFFKSPVALTDAAPDPAARIVAFSRLSPLTGAACPEAQARAAAYNARAPPPLRG